MSRADNGAILNIVETVLKLIDSLTEKIPLSVIHYIRLGALFLWTIGAITAIAFAWTKGGQSASQTGQDLYLSELKEKAVQEERQKEPPTVVIPDLDTFERKRDYVERESLLPEEAKRPVPTELPPFLNERSAADLPNAFLPAFKPERESLGETGEGGPPLLNKDDLKTGKEPKEERQRKSQSDRAEFLPLE